MSKVMVGILLLCLVAAVGAQVVRRQNRAGRAEMAGDKEYTFAVEGRTRRYFVHVPRQHDPGKPYPVVLVFHGGGGRADSVRRQSQMNRVADRYGFLVVYPDGTGWGRSLTWNAGTCCGYAVRYQVDDVGFVRALLDRELPAHYQIDPRRVYATGISNGAMLCYRLACELSDRLAAIGPVSGDLGVEGPAPSRPVPIIHFHGMHDQNCPYQGGIGAKAISRIPHRSIPDTIAWWVRVNHCRKEPVEVTKERDFIRTRYEPPPGTAGAPVVLYALPEGGHNWPGGVDTTAFLGTGKHIKSVDASTLMWKFFAQQALPSRAGAGRE